MSSFIDKLKTQLGGYFAKEKDLATVATTGDYNDLINAPQGGGGGGLTPYVLKLPRNILQDGLNQSLDNYNSYLDQTNKELDGTTEFLLSIYNIGAWDTTEVKFFAVSNNDNNRYYPYKVEYDYYDNDCYEIYFYNLPLGSIELRSIPFALQNIFFEIVDGVYEYQYTEPNPEQTA